MKPDEQNELERLRKREQAMREALEQIRKAGHECRERALDEGINVHWACRLINAALDDEETK